MPRVKIRVKRAASCIIVRQDLDNRENVASLTAGHVIIIIVKHK